MRGALNKEQVQMTVSKVLGTILSEEAKRQNLSDRKVGERAGHKNALYKLKSGGTVTVESLWGLAGAVGLPVEELAYRVNQRLRTP
jgi:transcriptional regulator with XRE-family HTH domain